DEDICHAPLISVFIFSPAPCFPPVSCPPLPRLKDEDAAIREGAGPRDPSQDACRWAALSGSEGRDGGGELVIPPSLSPHSASVSPGRKNKLDPCILAR
ncbi:Condensin-2 complex subunit G2, partial [Dissostichus eleginoides]